MRIVIMTVHGTFARGVRIRQHIDSSQLGWPSVAKNFGPPKNTAALGYSAALVNAC